MSGTTATATVAIRLLERRRSDDNDGESPRDEGRQCLDRYRCHRLFNKPQSGLDAIAYDNDDAAANLPLINDAEAADGMALET